MTSLTVRFDLGPDITPAQFSRVAADFSSFVDLAQRWAERDAVRDATEHIRRQRFSEIEVDRYRLRENDIADLRLFNQSVELWDDYANAPFDSWVEVAWRWYNLRQDKAGRAPLFPLTPLGGPPSLESFAPELFSRLVAQEVRERRPRPLTLDSVHYRNPIEFTLQDGVTVGSLLLGTGAIPRLLDVLKDYTKSGRRRRSAEADEAVATARLREAEASEAELRLEILEALARNEFLEGPRLETLVEIIDETEGAHQLLARVAELEPSVLSAGSDE
ncbi:MAG: hypothetical protein OXN95_06720 [bacterium]|nr:hypothetical protein [bacterium]